MKIELLVLVGSALAAIPESTDFRYPLAYNVIPRNLNFRVPLEVDSEGRLFARMNFTNIPGGRIINMRVDARDNTCVGHFVAHFDEINRAITSLVEDTQNTPPFQYTEDHVIPTGEDDETSFYSLGIGPNSQLTTLGGATAVIRNYANHSAAELVLGTNMDYFAQQCLPGTIASIDFSNNLQSATTSFQLVTTDDGTVEHEFPGPYIFTTAYPTLSRSIVGVPDRVFNSTVDAIERLGAPRQPGSLHLPSIFTNCSRIIISNPSLPSIRVETPSGYFVLFPEDYMILNEETQTCLLAISYVETNIASFLVQPAATPCYQRHDLHHWSCAFV